MNMIGKIYETTIPEKCLISGIYAKYDYADCFNIEFFNRREIKLEEIAKKFIWDNPKWVLLLSNIRDKIVGVFGLKTAKDLDIKKEPEELVIQKNKRLGFFNVIDNNEQEILMGEDDIHLNFKLSIILINDAGNYTLRVTTVVEFNNILGNIYFFFIKPFHRLIVKNGIKRLLNNLNK
jgi:hypothetical protein